MGPKFGIQIGFGGSSEKPEEAPAEESSSDSSSESSFGDSSSESSSESSFGDSSSESSDVSAETSYSTEETPSETPAEESSFGDSSSDSSSDSSFGDFSSESSSESFGDSSSDSFGDSSSSDTSYETPTEETPSEETPSEEPPPEDAPAAEEAPAEEPAPAGSGMALSMSGRGLSLETAVEAGSGRTPVKGYVKWVSPGMLMRGGPQDAAGLARLKEQGITTVINLGTADAKWRAAVEKAGMRPVALTSMGDEVLSEDEVEAFLGLARKSSNWPLFVQCDDGVERTGALCAVFRIATEGWTADRAIQEAKQMGMKSSAQIDFVKQIYDEFKAGAFRK